MKYEVVNKLNPKICMLSKRLYWLSICLFSVLGFSNFSYSNIQVFGLKNWVFLSHVLAEVNHGQWDSQKRDDYFKAEAVSNRNGYLAHFDLVTDMKALLCTHAESCLAPKKSNWVISLHTMCTFSFEPIHQRLQRFSFRWSFKITRILLNGKSSQCTQICK